MPRRSLAEQGAPTQPQKASTTTRAPGAMATSRNPGDGSQRLLNFKHELVARLVAVRNLSHADAWRAVYDKDGKATTKKAQNEGRRICTQNPAVVVRIQYLTDQVILRDVESTAVSREWVEKEMVETYQGARNDGHWPAAVKALELMGIDKGMYVRRTSVQKTSTPIEAENRDELVEQFVRLARDAFGPIDSGALRTLFAKAVGEPAPPTLEAEASEDATGEDTIGETAGSA